MFRFFAIFSLFLFSYVLFFEMDIKAQEYSDLQIKSSYKSKKTCENKKTYKTANIDSYCDYSIRFCNH